VEVRTGPRRFSQGRRDVRLPRAVRPRPPRRAPPRAALGHARRGRRILSVPRCQVPAVRTRTGAGPAIESGHLVAEVDLTDEQGYPRCATVRPPHATWSSGS